jgi:hypothetical protein
MQPRTSDTSCFATTGPRALKAFRSHPGHGGELRWDAPRDSRRALARRETTGEDFHARQRRTPSPDRGRLPETTGSDARPVLLPGAPRRCRRPLASLARLWPEVCQRHVAPITRRQRASPPRRRPRVPAPAAAAALKSCGPCRTPLPSARERSPGCPRTTPRIPFPVPQRAHEHLHHEPVREHKLPADRCWLEDVRPQKRTALRASKEPVVLSRATAR